MADETRTVDVRANLIAGGDLGAALVGLSGQADALGAKVRAVASGAVAGAVSPAAGVALAGGVPPPPTADPKEIQKDTLDAFANARAAVALVGRDFSGFGDKLQEMTATDLLGVARQHEGLWQDILEKSRGGSAELRAAHAQLWKDLAAAPADKVPQIIGQFQAGVGGMVAAAGEFNNTFVGKLSLYLEGLADKASTVKGSFSLAGSAAGAVAGGVGALAGGGAAMLGLALPNVGAFNPAIVESFSAALGDVSAIIGGSLSPVVEVVTEALRELQPVFLAVGDVLSSFVTPIVGALRDVLSGGLVGALSEALEALKPLATLIGHVFAAALLIIAKVVEVIAKGVGALGRLVGIDTARSDREGATSASRQQASFGPLADVQTRAIQAALGGNVQQQQLDELREVRRLLARQQGQRPAEPAVGD